MLLQVKTILYLIFYNCYKPKCCVENSEDPCQLASGQLIWIYTVFNLVSYCFKRIFTCILFKYIEGLAMLFVHYLFLGGQVKFSLDR